MFTGQDQDRRRYWSLIALNGISKVRELPKSRTATAASGVAPLPSPHHKVLPSAVTWYRTPGVGGDPLMPPPTPPSQFLNSEKSFSRQHFLGFNGCSVREKRFKLPISSHPSVPPLPLLVFFCRNHLCPIFPGLPDTILREAIILMTPSGRPQKCPQGLLPSNPPGSFI